MAPARQELLPAYGDLRGPRGGGAGNSKRQRSMWRRGVVVPWVSAFLLLRYGENPVPPG